MAVFLSHDIDLINSGWLEDAAYTFKKRKFLKSLQLLSHKLRGHSDWDNLEEILDLEEQLNVKSTFFFLPEQGKENADYALDQVRHYFPLIKEKGSEIGLHGSLGSGASKKQLLRDLHNLNEDIAGNRFHFLKYDPVQTGAVLEDAGFSYDASLGFAEQIGFRHGFCFPFRPYNLGEQRPFDFTELPLMLMDTTLRQPGYMGDKPGRFEEVEQLVGEVEKFGGLLSILWHNNYFTSYKFEGWKQKYVDMIQMLKAKNAGFYTGAEIAAVFSNSNS